MKIKLLPIAVILFSLSNFHCNPDCFSIVGLEITPPACPPGFEVLISAQPNSSLQGRRVFFNNTEAETRYVNGWGLIATVPQNLSSGKVELKIEDKDCEDFTISTFDVVNESGFFNTPDYIIPSPPQVVIPTFTGNIFPPSVTNAWISPDNPDYCIWFRFVMNTLPNGSVVETSVLRTNTVSNFPDGSYELGVCELLGTLTGNPPNPTPTYYHNHPVSGIIDKASNKVHIFIDRTSNNPNGANLGIEELEGFFTNIPEQYEEWGKPNPFVCANPGWKQERGHMMVLRSKMTGRQHVLYQQQ